MEYQTDSRRTGLAVISFAGLFLIRSTAVVVRIIRKSLILSARSYRPPPPSRSDAERSTVVAEERKKGDAKRADVRGGEGARELNPHR